MHEHTLGTINLIIWIPVGVTYGTNQKWKHMNYDNLVAWYCPSCEVKCYCSEASAEQLHGGLYFLEAIGMGRKEPFGTNTWSRNKSIESARCWLSHWAILAASSRILICCEPTIACLTYKYWEHFHAKAVRNADNMFCFWTVASAIAFIGLSKLFKVT